MNSHRYTGSEARRIQRYAWGLGIVWTLAVCLSLAFNWWQEGQGAIGAAREAARAQFQKDVLYRLWNAGHGSVYVPVTETTQPNPNLAHVPERDIETPSGKPLTMMNPAFMTRQVHEMGEALQGLYSHITSLNPIRPENAPDSWERSALEAFETGAEEVASVEKMKGEPYLRLMRPLITVEECLKCHAKQGYRVGEVRGGISTSTPLEPYMAMVARERQTAAVGHGLLWLFGVGLIAFGSRRLQVDVGGIIAAEEALRHTNRELALAQRIAGVGNWSFDPEVGLPVWSEEVYVIYERDPAKGPIPVSEYPSLYQGEWFSLFHESIRRAIDEGEGYEIELKLVLPSGKVKWIQAIGEPDPERGPLGHCVRGTIQDITERKEAELRIQDDVALYRTLLDDIPMVSVQGFDQNGVVRYWNEGAARIYGYSADEAMGRNIVELIVPEALREATLESFEQMAELGLSMPPTEWTLLNKDGNEVQVYTSNSVVKLPGRPTEIFCFDIDLTELKKAAEDRRDLQDRLNQAQRLESVGRLAGGVAHDFNNMLNVILGNVEMALEETPPDHPLREELQEIEEAARRSADLTRQLLAFARRQTAIPKTLDLNATIASMHKMLDRLIGESIELRWKPGAGVDCVRMDPSQLDQILANLVVNARDAIDGSGLVVIETANIVADAEYCAAHPDCQPGGYVRISVSDNGAGMDAGTRDRIFEPFFTTKPQGEGTGLGLATIYGIVKQNEGFIIVYSEKGRGTTFQVHLPVQVGEDEAPVLEQPLPPQTASGRCVLIVEDEAAILALGKKMLERLGFKVLAAETPQQAIRQVESHPDAIDLVLTDVIMPGMNGRDMADRIGEMRPGIRFAFMSGYTADVIASHGVLDPGVHYLQKPFTAQQLREVLGRALAV